MPSIEKSSRSRRFATRAVAVGALTVIPLAAIAAPAFAATGTPDATATTVSLDWPAPGPNGPDLPGDPGGPRGDNHGDRGPAPGRQLPPTGSFGSS